MTYEKALEIGGKEWKGKRVYFNTDEQKAFLHGVRIEGKDGYVDGEKISRNNLFKIRSTKPYFDIESGRLIGIIQKFASCAGYAEIK